MLRPDDIETIMHRVQQKKVRVEYTTTTIQANVPLERPFFYKRIQGRVHVWIFRARNHSDCHLADQTELVARLENKLRENSEGKRQAKLLHGGSGERENSEGARGTDEEKQRLVKRLRF